MKLSLHVESGHPLQDKGFLRPLLQGTAFIVASVMSQAQFEELYEQVLSTFIDIVGPDFYFDEIEWEWAAPLFDFGDGNQF